MGETVAYKREESVPMVLVTSGREIDIKCPSCGLKETITLKKAIASTTRANCKKCKAAFLVKPNTREFIRKDADFAGVMHRRPLSNVKKDDAIIARVKDLSREGMGLAVAQFVPRRYHLEVSETIYVKFTLPKKTGNVELEVETTIRNIVPHKVSGTYKIGLKFAHIDEDTQREIGLFLW